MLNWYYRHRIGDVYARCVDGKVRRANIFGGNAFCIFTFWFKDEKTGKPKEKFLNFYQDEKHIKNIIKGEGKLTPIDDITSIRLNMYFPEAPILVKYLCKWYKVTLYYKEPKPEKSSRK